MFFVFFFSHYHCWEWQLQYPCVLWTLALLAAFVSNTTTRVPVTICPTYFEKIDLLISNSPSLLIDLWSMWRSLQKLAPSVESKGSYGEGLVSGSLVALLPMTSLETYVACEVGTAWKLALYSLHPARWSVPCKPVVQAMHLSFPRCFFFVFWLLFAPSL